MAKKPKIVEHKKQNRIKTNGEQWGARRYVSYSPYTSTFYLQEYLKKNTDVNHKIDLEALIGKKDGLLVDESVEAFGREDAIKNKLTELTRATYNIDEVIHNVRAKRENSDNLIDKARVIFDDTPLCVGIAKDDEERIDDSTAGRKYPKDTRFTNIYYNHVYSYDELDDIIESIQQNKSLTENESSVLIDKLIKELASDFYPNPKEINIRKFYEPKSKNKDYTSENIKTIDRAIKEKKKIIFNFYVYNIDKKLELANEDVILHPYYLVANNNRIYLIAKADWSPDATIWRVELMRDVEMLEDKAAEKNTVSDVPEEWDEAWQYKHLNMTFGKPVKAWIRVKEYSYDEKGNKKKLSSTFLVDTFGENFKIVPLPDGHKYKMEDYVVIEVICAAYALKNWALQYADRVEVLPPVNKGDYDVRGDVIKSLKALNEKYGIK